MPDDDATTPAARPSRPPSKQSQSSNSMKKPSQPQPAQAPSPSSWFTLPHPLRRVFDRFPLVTYPANLLPQRSSKQGNENVLYIFQKLDPKSRDAPSYNPSCLKWQAYLKFHGIPLKTRPSNNHASPTGSLPFLLPASTSSDPHRPVSPIPANRIARWVVSQGGKEDPLIWRQDAYAALIDHNIRSAWLYYLYLDQDNFQSVARPMYVTSVSSALPVHWALAHQLQQAARDELLKFSPVIDPHYLYRQASHAFRALSQLLGDNKFFFGQSTPGLFDASLFAYTQIILDDELDWVNLDLKLELQQYSNLDSSG
ncbi:hypothetical protein PV10_09198 [Exophiala mesophila]|uniref:Thioredoxin-like fold domain-containing protein n=1 Tax=Exophiala mesophila TaxID=212818 RepID=A0A0D1YZL6_EXOME|nr:uncharacterized protein PV10_09198 [Exophiala mesophila]KIV88022.1 hypothetical protein PV10_09198 [Exophiala mesophila]